MPVMPNHTLAQSEIRGMIRFELGQAPAMLYVEARSKSPETRMGAMDALAARVAKRFEPLTLTRELDENWTACPFVGVQVAPAVRKE